MTTVAEGVETPEQFELLANLGCDQSQGYLHGRPLAAADIESFFRNGTGSFPKRSSNREVTSVALRG